MLKRVWKKIGPNRLDRLLKKAAKKGAKSVLIPWNRGLGDIPLGLYAIVKRVRDYLPEAQITFLTRADLKEGFQMMPNVGISVDPTWKRGAPAVLPADLPHFDLIIERADPSSWTPWQRGSLVPKLEWNETWDALSEKFGLPSGCVAAHVHCETGYYHERNWPASHWQQLFDQIDQPIVLLGMKKEPLFRHHSLFDLRGETSLYEMLAILKNHCSTLIAPDSGVLAMTYFLNTPFRLKIVSLWADPNHGVLKQNVASPNQLLTHIPVVSPNRKDAALITVQQVAHAIKGDSLIDAFRQRDTAIPQSLRAVTQYDTPTSEMKKRGQQLLSDGRVACLVLAGGEGSRLGTSCPKALVPVSPIRQKTLLQLVCEKTAAASKVYGTPLSLAIMTSQTNRAEIESFLEQHNYFGLTTILLFEQKSAPLLSDDEEVVGSGPNGNGEALQLLSTSGIAKKWREAGVEMVNVIPIDNPLADPFDAALCGYHALQNNEVSIKAMIRDDRREKVGVVVERDGRVGVQEYSELPEGFEAPIAHIGLLCLSLPWIEKIERCDLPWHFAHKKRGDRMVWKPEKFLFDTLAYAHHVGVVVYPRHDVYAPLKNSTGDKSLKTVQQAMTDFDRRQIEGEILTPFELDPIFYYLKEKPRDISPYILS